MAEYVVSPAVQIFRPVLSGCCLRFWLTWYAPRVNFIVYVDDQAHEKSYQARDTYKEGLHESYRTVDNAITVCSTLVEPFMENTFSIDVQDNSRIVPFVDLPTRAPTAPPLPSHLPRPDHCGSPTAAFWHLHFKRTLSVHFNGGDVSLEPHDPSPQALMDELVEDCADLQDGKWQSGVGAEVLAEFMRQTISMNDACDRFESDDESESSVDGGQSLADFNGYEDEESHTMDASFIQ
ncbi:hypothetical protein B0H12DRAFT_299420 [Mycena haematopus]|nr:hypothetical protein B0H12DRAFT_299420 [Mycena haematopus]